MPVLAVDFRDLASLQRELDEARVRVARAEELPADAADLLRSIAIVLKDSGADAFGEAVDPYRVIELQQVAIDALLALEEADERRRIEGAELALAALQEVLVGIEDEANVRDGRSGREIARWLKTATETTNHELADLLSISERKLERWLSGESEPADDDEMRLRIVARIVDQLRHAMTPYGAVRWLSRPHPELGGDAPRELLDAPEAAARLFALAARARRSDAS